MQNLISAEVKDKIKRQSLEESLFMPELTQNVLEKMMAKDYNEILLLSLCSPEYRMELLDKINNPNFEFSIPKVGYVPKDDGTLREVLILPQEERFLMNLINTIYSIKYDYMISDRCMAYTIGKSTGKTVKLIAEQNQDGIKGDISKYFDSVNQEIINEILNKCNTGSNIEKAVFKFYNTNLVSVDGEVTKRFKSLCQGCGLSGFLCNVALRDFDDEMTKLNDSYYRYSDDFILLGKNCEEALKIGIKILSEKGLSLKETKVKRVSCEEEYKFLGFGIIDNNIVIPESKFISKKKNIKHIIKKVRGDFVKNKKPLDDKFLKKCIRSINSSMFGMGDNPEYGWLVHMCKTITDTDRLNKLDEYIKETIRHYYTGKSSKTHGYNKLSDQKLYDLGYVSLNHWYNVINSKKDLFHSEYRKHIRNNRCELRF